jgi:hypothetical protein
MRASFLKASLASIAALGAVANFSPAQAQDSSIQLNQCYDNSTFSAQLEAEGLQKVILAKTVVDTGKPELELFPIEVFANFEDGSGYIVKYDNCASESSINASASQSVNGSTAILKLKNVNLLNRNDPNVNLQIAGQYNNEIAQADCDKLQKEGCTTYNNALATQTANNFGAMMQSHSLVLKGEKYVEGPLVTITAKDEKMGVLFTTRTSGASFLKMNFESIKYTDAAKAFLNKPKELASNPNVVGSLETYNPTLKIN